MELKKKFEDSLKESFEKFKSFFYNHPEALVFVDDKGFIIDINPKFTEIFGFTLDDLKGKNINDTFFVPEELKDEGKKLDEIALKTGYVNFETKRKRKDGTVIPVSISGSPIIINGEIKGIIGLYIDLSEKKRREEELKFLSTHDTLTGLYNKAFFEEKFNIEKERAKRYNEKLAILFVDLYEFKYINDKYGHSFGDIVLKEIAKKFEKNLRKYDLIARAGGDEFLILVTNIKDIDCLISITKRFINNIFDNLIINEIKVDTGVNIGISIYPDDGEELDELIKKADMAMYHAKSIGKNIFSFYSKELNIESKISEPRKIERKFESIFNNIPIGIIVFEKNRIINFVNKKGEEILGYEREEIIGKDIKELFNIKYDEKLEEFFENKLSEYKLEIEYKNKENIKILNLTFYLIFDKDYNLYYYLLTINDITKEKFLTHELKREKDFSLILLDNIEAIVTIEDLDGNILYINKKGEEILGYEREEIIGKSWVDYFTPEYYKDKLKIFYDKLKKGEIEEVKVNINPIKSKNGEEKIILWKNSFILDQKGEKKLLSSGIDITKELKFQKALREKEELLNKILDTSDEIIFIKDINGKYIYVNETFSKKFDLPINEIINKSDFDLFSENEAKKIKEIDKSVIESKNKITTEDVLTINNKTHIFRTTKSPIFDDSGNVIGIAGFAEDITQLKQKEKEIENLIGALNEELYIQNKIRKIINMLISQKNLDELLKLFIKEIEDIVKSDCSDIALIEGMRVKTKIYKGFEKYGIENFIKNLEIDINDSPSNLLVLENKKPLIINDTSKDKTLSCLVKIPIIKSFMNIPIIVGDKVIGFLRLVSEKENAFSQRDAERLLILAGSLGLAIENIRNLEKVNKFLNQILHLIDKIAELKDPYTHGHQEKVNKLAVQIGEKLKLSHDEIENLKIASLIHDIGKLILPFEILTKPSKLTEKEYEIIKEHPRYGYELIKDFDLPEEIKLAILQHHERLNGSGYPFGLKDDEILLDVFEAMTSHRPYRPAYSVEDALKELKENKGILYDPQVVDALIELYNEGKLV
jgi:diguanylate cyclase (GGDEF)-like protein/PAS domain S-box-containing protein